MRQDRIVLPISKYLTNAVLQYPAPILFDASGHQREQKGEKYRFVSLRYHQEPSIHIDAPVSLGQVEFNQDARGLILNPQTLEFLQPAGELTVIGVFNHLELWSEESFREWVSYFHESHREEYREMMRQATRRARIRTPALSVIQSL